MDLFFQNALGVSVNNGWRYGIYLREVLCKVEIWEMCQLQDEIIAFLPLNLQLKAHQQQHYCSTNRSQQQNHSEYEMVNKEEKSNKLCLIETVF